MATRSTLIVFLLPIVLSFVLGGAVLGLILQEPGRDLNMMNFSVTVGGSSDSVKILGLEPQYRASEQVRVQVAVFDAKYDCGDLYITVFRSDTGEVVAQNGYFEQCYADSGAALPIGESFSAVVEESGRYEIKADMYDQSQKSTASARERFTVV